ncbi:CD209 antigen-like protein C [Lampris incognitus]|uniref:CD209 antigen-like protein C n=1 Tax=Lampris incognitus TaxID=2546036 RepID=UPI0024B5B5A1|nr:CD209 antigen-like protein C [Lampris incognitus]
MEAMEDELNYEVVLFKTHGTSTQEGRDVEKSVYAAVKYKEEETDEISPISDKKKKCLPYIPLWLVTVGLGILCVILISVIIALCCHFISVNVRLWSKLSSLERQTVCKPCLDGWLPFQSSCYWFADSGFSLHWKTWEESQSHCRYYQAHLVTIESQEEQEFINNHTEFYHDENHGYWIGLTDNTADRQWRWVSGSPLTLSFWTTRRSYSSFRCGLSKARGRAGASWGKASCSMKNRWMCESKALTKPD